MPWWRRKKTEALQHECTPVDPIQLHDPLKGDWKLVDSDGKPNINDLWMVTRDIDAIKFNLKQYGYELALKLSKGLADREVTGPRMVNLDCKASTQADMESDWAAYWLNEIQLKVVYHRKLWEYAYVLQALWENGKIKSGSRGIGFGCGIEPVPSYLTSKGVEVTITDLPPTSDEFKRWHDTAQHTTNLKKSHHPGLVSIEEFERLASLRYVDMNEIPSELTGYDFCWSICALEHVGSIRQGLDFIENSLQTLAPGGVAVHTTEYNFTREDKTIDNWPTVLFMRKHFQEIHDRLSSKGHKIAPLDFSIGSQPLDRFIDLPPYWHENEFMTQQMPEAPHLKLTIDGFPSTCFGLIVKKAS